MAPPPRVSIEPEARSLLHILIFADPIAQAWMNRKTADLERRLRGMRRGVQLGQAGASALR